MPPSSSPGLTPAGLSEALAKAETDRRVLGNLPRYRTKADRAEVEAHMREENRYDAPDWTLPSDISLPDLVALLDADKHFGAPDDVGAVLVDLADRGFAKNTGGDRWAMTSDGLDALNA